MLSAFAYDLARLADAALSDVDPDTLRGLDPEELEAAALDVLDSAGLVPRGLRDDVRLRMRAFIGNVRARLTPHRPRPYDGPVTLIQTVETADTDAAVWDTLCPRLERRIVPGDHYTMLRPPHLATLATAVGDALREAVTR